jgi:polyribonucleotide nucleotidyltransferase
MCVCVICLVKQARKPLSTQVVDGLVDGVETFGIFVDFWSHKEEYRGLCHISQVSGSKIGKWEKSHAIYSRLIYALKPGE